MIGVYMQELLVDQGFTVDQRLDEKTIHSLVHGLSQWLWKAIQNIRGNWPKFLSWSALHRLRWGTLDNIQWLEQDTYRNAFGLSDQGRLCKIRKF